MAFSFQCARHEMRKVYYWSGSFMCVVGLLLFIILLLRVVLDDRSFVPTAVSGYCAIFATILSLFQILEHLTCFAHPECQSKTVRILFMVPLYAIISWISLLAPSAAEYLNLIRDAYESYAIYAFFQLMIALMGGVDALYRSLMIEARPPLQRYFPCCCLDPIKVAPTFVQNCRRCIFQFMIIKPLVTVLVIALKATDHLSSITDPTGGYFWATLVYNISITIAFTALLDFYHGLKDFLEGKNAFLKFLCIKSVIFLSFWQGLLIQLLSAAELLPDFGGIWSAKEAPTALQDLLICVEMMFVAFAHKYCFGSAEYIQEDAEQGEEGDDHYADHFTPDIIVDSVSGLGAARTLPDIRYSILENLKYTLKHQDVLQDFSDIVRNR